MNWPKVRLSDICRPRQWPTITGDQMLGSGYPVYGANGQIGFYSTFNHEDPTVLITCRGATCGTINTSSPRAYITGNAMALDDLSPAMDRGFLAHYLTHRRLDDVISGTAQPQITREGLANLTVPQPPIEEQRRIAAILDQAEALRAKRRQALAKLDTLAQSIFVEMFGDPQAKRPKMRPLSDLILDGDGINYGVVQPGDNCPNGKPVIRVGDFQRGWIRTDALKLISPEIEAAYKRSRLRGDELLISCVGSIGFVALCTKAVSGFNIARAVARVPFDREKIDAQYLLSYLQSAFVQRFFISEVRTVAQPTLNIKQISETPIFIPDRALQKLFAQRVSSVRSIYAMQAASRDSIESNFRSLQHRAFRGEL